MIFESIKTYSAPEKIHARPAAAIAKWASNIETQNPGTQISIGKVGSQDGIRCNSIVGIMLLGIKQGVNVILRVQSSSNDLSQRVQSEFENLLGTFRDNPEFTTPYIPPEIPTRSSAIERIPVTTNTNKSNQGEQNHRDLLNLSFTGQDMLILQYESCLHSLKDFFHPQQCKGLFSIEDSTRIILLVQEKFIGNISGVSIEKFIFDRDYSDYSDFYESFTSQFSTIFLDIMIYKNAMFNRIGINMARDKLQNAISEYQIKVREINKEALVTNLDKISACIEACEKNPENFSILATELINYIGIHRDSMHIAMFILHSYPDIERVSKYKDGFISVLKRSLEMGKEYLQTM